MLVGGTTVVYQFALNFSAILVIRRSRVSWALAPSTWRTYSFFMEGADFSKASSAFALIKASFKSVGISTVRGSKSNSKVTLASSPP